jgi:hypothetical protein
MKCCNFKLKFKTLEILTSSEHAVLNSNSQMLLTCVPAAAEQSWGPAWAGESPMFGVDN